MQIDYCTSRHDIYGKIHTLVESNTLHEIGICGLSNLIDIHKDLIFQQQNDNELHNLLNCLSAKVLSDFPTREGLALSLQIHDIALGIFVPWNSLFPELWEEILINIPPRRSKFEDRLQKPNLKIVAFISRKFQQKALTTKHRWQGEQIVSLKLCSCINAKEAVEYIIKNKLTGANLEEFPDLLDEDLIKLLNSRPDMERLLIKRAPITEQSINCLESLSQLRELSITDCIQAVGHLNLTYCKNLEVLDCSGSSLIADISLPKDAHYLKFVNFKGCSQLRTINFADCSPKLKIADFSKCIHLRQLILPKELPCLENLNCQNCDIIKIVQLPTVIPKLKVLSFEHCTALEGFELPSDLPMLEEFDCGFCSEIRKIVLPQAMPRLQWFACNGCIKLKFLTLPLNVAELQEISCEGCLELVQFNSPHNAPLLGWVDLEGCAKLMAVSLTNNSSLKTLYVNGCRELRGVTFPDVMPKLSNLYCKNCTNLNQVNLPAEAPRLLEVNLEGCVQLRPEKVTHSEKYRNAIKL